ncbi:NIPSNAP family protein [Noviherbaspirillum denitrificans]|uniref:NIPSNAP domain-containing protein n=1 Tax=Noviherbaspirillum denitrificans TaxID=1968433 RepID=A0A254TE69_9BURK|nr:NIPSNAP family protein [Noviherbaspirillum denitrificans]OWW20447.1 hypothetical protein AYR66_14080 [Noviherbaspirillum denitrificans]
MIYELKKYTPAPGKEAALKERFARVTLPIFKRIGIEVLHCFEDPKNPNDLYYLTAFRTEQDRELAWKAFGADPEWKSAKAASETDGPLLAAQTSVDLRPTSFSPRDAS